MGHDLGASASNETMSDAGDNTIIINTTEVILPDMSETLGLSVTMSILLAQSMQAVKS